MVLYTRQLNLFHSWIIDESIHLYVHDLSSTNEQHSHNCTQTCTINVDALLQIFTSMSIFLFKEDLSLRCKLSSKYDATFIKCILTYANKAIFRLHAWICPPKTKQLWNDFIQACNWLIPCNKADALLFGQERCLFIYPYYCSKLTSTIYSLGYNLSLKGWLYMYMVHKDCMLCLLYISICCNMIGLTTDKLRLFTQT